MILEDFDQDIINLNPDQLEMASPLELSQYMIENWKLIYYDQGCMRASSLSHAELFNFPDDINKGLKMEVTFKRILTNEILTTYLPSFFLIGICYGTVFFKSFYFEAVVTVNLTVMLVATTLFIRYLFKDLMKT